MSVPQIPEEKNRPSLCEVTIDLLKSVAMEETALSHILNAEGERSQAMIKRFEHCCGTPSLQEMEESVRQTEKILNTIIMKEWLLLKKLDTALEINQKLGGKFKESVRCSTCRRCPCCCRALDCDKTRRKD